MRHMPVKEKGVGFRYRTKVEFDIFAVELDAIATNGTSNGYRTIFEVDTITMNEKL